MNLLGRTAKEEGNNSRCKISLFCCYNNFHVKPFVGFPHTRVSRVKTMLNVYVFGFLFMLCIVMKLNCIFGA
jgi:hypothetical protein